MRCVRFGAFFAIGLDCSALMAGFDSELQYVIVLSPMKEVEHVFSRW